MAETGAEPVRLRRCGTRADIARRYRCEFVDLSDFQLHHDLFERSGAPDVPL